MSKEGTIWNWKTAGFGFITPKCHVNGYPKDLFFHQSDLRGELRDHGGSLKRGDPVLYDELWDSRKSKIRATNVRFGDDDCQGAGSRAIATSQRRSVKEAQSRSRPRKKSAPTSKSKSCDRKTRDRKTRERDRRRRRDEEGDGIAGPGTAAPPPPTEPEAAAAAAGRGGGPAEEVVELMRQMLAQK